MCLCQEKDGEENSGPMKEHESSKKDELIFSEFLVLSIFYCKSNSLKADESQNSAQNVIILYVDPPEYSVNLFCIYILSFRN